MTTSRDPDRMIHAFLREDAGQLDDQVYDAVRAEIEQKRQRVVIGPWRVPTMSKLLPIGLGAAAVIAVLFLGSRFIGSPSSNVGGPASEPPASAAPSGGAGIGGAVARIPSAADPELHLADAWDLRVLPRGMDRSSGDRALDGWPGSPHFARPVCRPPVRPGPDRRPVPDHRLAADRRFHARRVGRRRQIAGRSEVARQPSRSPWTAPPD